MSETTVLIEIKPYLKKYLLALYGQEPIKFPKRHDYNVMIVRKLSKPPINYKPCLDRTNTVEISLPFNYLKDVSVYSYLGFHDKIAIRKQFDTDFIHDYKQYIDKKMNEGFNRKEATILCQKMYDIEESELTFDAFYKHFWRKSLLRTAIFSFSIF